MALDLAEYRAARAELREAAAAAWPSTRAAIAAELTAGRLPRHHPEPQTMPPTVTVTIRVSPETLAELDALAAHAAATVGAWGRVSRSSVAAEALRRGVAALAAELTAAPAAPAAPRRPMAPAPVETAPVETAPAETAPEAVAAAEALRALRAAGVPLDELGAALGVGPSAVSRWASGSRGIPSGRWAELVELAAERLP